MTVPPWDVLARAYDKRLTYRLAADTGLDMPRTFYARSLDELARAGLRVSGRPEAGVQAGGEPVHARQGVARRRPRDPAGAVRRSLRRLVGADVVMIQELVPGGGDTQFSHGALCVDGRTLASVTARRTRQYPVDFGHSSSFVETVSEPAVEDAATRLLRAMRYTGLAEVEFKYDRRDGRYKLLDVNPRVWTWHALCGAAGVDFPYLLWRVDPRRARGRGPRTSRRPMGAHEHGCGGRRERDVTRTPFNPRVRQVVDTARSVLDPRRRRSRTRARCGFR